MILEIRSESDLDLLESRIREIMGSQRLDPCLLRSKAYLDFRHALLRELQDPTRATFGRCLRMGPVVLRSIEPLLVWCGVAEITL